MPLIASAGDVALIVLAAFWGLLVMVLCVVLLNTFRVLESVKVLIDGIREETVPLLSEVKVSVQNVNRELDRLDGVVETAGRIARRAERVSDLVEQAVSNPLVKLIGFGTGVSRALRRLRRGKAGG